MGQVFEFLGKQSYSSEVLVVDNGSRDQTLQVAREYMRSFPDLRILHEDRRGKGLAVQRGMLEACGEYRFMCDADLSMPIEQVNHFIPPELAQVDIAIASREAPGAVRYDEPLYRHWGGRAINLLIRLLALPGLRDTQCGFKCFRAGVAEDIFRRQTFTGISFDPEVLYIARLRGYRVLEIPVPWYYSGESRIHLIRDTLSLGRDLLIVRRNARRGLYDSA
jgi:dolichyl-phosphate beta-glucosyltransferase